MNNIPKHLLESKLITDEQWEEYQNLKQKIKLKNNYILDINDIKSLRDKPMRLYVGFGKEIKVNYCIEHLDGTFTEITKKEYKLLKKVLKNNNKNF